MAAGPCIGLSRLAAAIPTAIRPRSSSISELERLEQEEIKRLEQLEQDYIAKVAELEDSNKSP